MGDNTNLMAGMMDSFVSGAGAGAGAGLGSVGNISGFSIPVSIPESYQALETVRVSPVFNPYAWAPQDTASNAKPTVFDSYNTYLKTNSPSYQPELFKSNFDNMYKYEDSLRKDMATFITKYPSLVQDENFKPLLTRVTDWHIGLNPTNIARATTIYTAEEGIPKELSTLRQSYDNFKTLMLAKDSQLISNVGEIESQLEDIRASNDAARTKNEAFALDIGTNKHYLALQQNISQMKNPQLTVDQRQQFELKANNNIQSMARDVALQQTTEIDHFLWKDTIHGRKIDYGVLFSVLSGVGGISISALTLEQQKKSERWQRQHLAEQEEKADERYEREFALQEAQIKPKGRSAPSGGGASGSMGAVHVK